MTNTSLTAAGMIAAVLQWVLLLILLRVFVYKPILAAMQKRRDTIAKQIGDADSLKVEAEKLRDEAHQLVERARDEAKQLMASARREADEQAKKIVEQAQREASYRQKAAIEEIEHERDLALASVRAQVADLVVFAAGKVLERSLTVQDQSRYVEEILKDVGQLQ
ncbi:MAG: F0F1 ATP synthase subunit B [Thermaerobacter sp.]|nr:F0F1 ATP synthase subunit B [Thermaerobacter sp.]